MSRKYIFLCVLSIILTSGFVFAENEILMWGSFSSNHNVLYLKSEVEKPYFDGFKPLLEILPFKMPDMIPEPGAKAMGVNPFRVTAGDYDRGEYFLGANNKPGSVPRISDQDAQWFKELARKGVCPKFMTLAGHQVISHGWHNHAETKFMFLPTLLDAVQRYPEVRQVLSCVKVAVFFGCNTMTNLEPHKADGSLYSPEELRKMYYGGERDKVTGTSAKNNTLEFYKARLAREYGPNNPEGHYDYYRGYDDTKKCLKKAVVHGKERDVENTECVFPDHGLFDGTHRYNYPYLLKRLLPNATLALGFSSASPNNDVATGILKAAVNAARRDLNEGLLPTNPNYIHNLFYTVADVTAPEQLRRRIVSLLRYHWPLKTYALNRNRTSGSISPEFPELDAEGIVPLEALRQMPLVKEASAYGVYDNDNILTIRTSRR